ncbi:MULTISPECIES: hypothetical protein [Nocardia]|nr:MULTISPECIES: hypothetical protein [Nocardia]
MSDNRAAAIRPDRVRVPRRPQQGRMSHNRAAAIRPDRVRVPRRSPEAH